MSFANCLPACGGKCKESAILWNNSVDVTVRISAPGPEFLPALRKSFSANKIILQYSRKWIKGGRNKEAILQLLLPR